MELALVSTQLLIGCVQMELREQSQPPESHSSWLRALMNLPDVSVNRHLPVTLSSMRGRNSLFLSVSDIKRSDGSRARLTDGVGAAPLVKTQSSQSSVSLPVVSSASQTAPAVPPATSSSDVSIQMMPRPQP